jgi:hypothetical protein
MSVENFRLAHGVESYNDLEQLRIELIQQNCYPPILKIPLHSISIILWLGNTHRELNSELSAYIIWIL